MFKWHIKTNKLTLDEDKKFIKIGVILPKTTFKKRDYQLTISNSLKDLDKVWKKKKNTQHEFDF